MAEITLSSSISVLGGIGPAREKQLAKLGIRTVYDLLTHFPRTYEDRTVIRPVCEMEVDVPACFRATVISYPRTHHIRKGMDITKVTVSDMTARLNLVFFNQPYVQDQLKYGQDYLFYGTLKEDYGHQIQNPEFEPISLSGTRTGTIVPVYALTAGISGKVIQRCVRQALHACGDSIPEILPRSVREKYELMGAAEAYRILHEPDSMADISKARRRTVFEEFFIFSAGLQLLRARRTQRAVSPWTHTDPSDFCRSLPYRLTGAQTQAIEDICRDLGSGTPMNRLIQGDVGSGKTAVAAAAACLAAAEGVQTAFMAPTEILAEQHFQTLEAMLRPHGIQPILLCGSLPAAKKRTALEAIASGEAKLVIATHAILTQTVTFQNLGLVITDEQHRFGVQQRDTLARKGDSPHLLFLSATPIPRTLSLVLYGDLDVSVLDELPPGRQKVETFCVGESMRDRVHAFVRKQVQEGHQAYVICPAVEENEETQLKAAETWSVHLQREVFPDLRVGCVHGRLKSAEKDEVMQSFARRELDVLVATTVIEVGVDVPNATLIIIEDADRFGLSQLHQLRGRVGRGRDQSYCVLITQNKNSEALPRLRALCATNDGFRIAEQDLALRGPGDFLGSRQHGLPQFRTANPEMDLQTLEEAKQATAILQWENLCRDPAFAPLLERISSLFAESGTWLN